VKTVFVFLILVYFLFDLFVNVFVLTNQTKPFIVQGFFFFFFFLQESLSALLSMGKTIKFYFKSGWMNFS
jgi:hypothetical protein